MSDHGTADRDTDGPSGDANAPSGDASRTSGDGDAAVSDVEITRMSLRGGGWIGYSEDAVFVDEGDQRVKVRNDAVERIALHTLEWDIAVMSLLLMGVGGYVVLTRNPLVGVGFLAVGAYSLYRTYRQRYELAISVQDRRNAVTVHPEHPVECHETLVDRVGLRE